MAAAPPSLQAGSLDGFFRRLSHRDELGPQERQALLDVAGEDRIIPSDTDLVSEGDTPTRSTLLVSGYTMRYRVLADGGRQITSIHVAGDFVDLHSFPLKEMDHSVGTLSECRVVAFAHSDLRILTETRPHLTRLLWLMTMLDSAIHREWLVGMGRLSALERLAHLICELLVRLEVVGANDGEGFAFPVTQGVLADTLGLSSVHLNRVLQELRQTGLVEWSGARVRVLDRARLMALSQFDDRYLHLEKRPR
jgi:CRP-like cAMP-binding protein